MSVPSRKRAGQERSFSAARLVVHIVSFAFFWGVLTAGTAWGVGIPVICLATAASLHTAPENRWSLAGIARFLPYFFWNSLRGGIDVASRALSPGLPIDPAVIRYEVSLDSTGARVLMANTVTLLPGTLSADLQGKVLLVHVLNRSGPFMEMLATLERRIANVVLQDDATGAR